LKRDCLDNIDSNLSSKASREIEVEELDFVFEDNIELNLSLKASQEGERKNLKELLINF